MRYVYKENVVTGGNYGPTLIVDLMNELDAIPGWDIYDDQTGLGDSSKYFVMEVTTSEGVGEEVYVVIGAQGTDYYFFEAWEGWDNVGHSGTGNWTGRSRLEHDSHTWATVSYRFAADEDHLFINMEPADSYAPCYMGLTTKLRPATDTATRGWIQCSWYYINDHSSTDQDGVGHSDDTRCPCLFGTDGTTENPRARLWRTNPNWDGYNNSGGPTGPYTGVQNPGDRRSAMYFYPLVLVESDTGGTSGFGPRGMLKSVLIHSDSYYANFARGQTMKIGSRDYVVYKTTISANDAYSRRNSWGQYYGSGNWQMCWAMPTSDYYVPAYIEGT